ncbi:MAG: hypothetical protein R3F59_19570 [Myxococcota bacterium]
MTTPLLLLLAPALGGCALGDLLSTRIVPAEVAGDADFELYATAPYAWAGSSLAAADLYDVGHVAIAAVAPGQRSRGAEGIVAVCGGALFSRTRRRPVDLEAEALTVIASGRDQALTGVYAGDFDGDGVADLFVADPSWPSTEVGQLYGFPGPLPIGRVDIEDAAWRWRGTRGDLAGFVAIPLGDWDGDGTDDLLVSLDNRRELVFAMGPLDGDGGLRAFPDRVRVDFGDGLAGAVGDLDGDGRLDLALGVPQLDRVYVFLHHPSGPVDADDADVVLIATAGSRFGAGLAVDDLDGDGVDDLAVGAPTSYGDRGSVQVFRGPLVAAVAPDLTVVGTDGGRLGDALLAPGDHDADGVRDLAAFRLDLVRTIVGAEGGVVADGGAWTLLSVGDLQGTRELEDAPALVHWAALDGSLAPDGAAVAADLNGDGRLDVVAGGPATMGAGAVFGWFAR